MTTPDPFKVCTNCPATYTYAAWRALPVVGIQHFTFDEPIPEEPHLAEIHVLRNCACGTTLAFRVGRANVRSQDEHGWMFDALIDLELARAELRKVNRALTALAADARSPHPHYP